MQNSQTLPFEFNNKTLLIIRGIPGSGKSTLARKFMELNHWALHYEADHYFDTAEGYKFDAAKLGAAHNWCQRSVHHGLHLGHSVIVANTFVTASEINPYLKMAEEEQALVKVIACEADYGSIHNVPQFNMDRMRRRWQEIRGEFKYDSRLSS